MPIALLAVLLLHVLAARRDSRGRPAPAIGFIPGDEQIASELEDFLGE